MLEQLLADKIGKLEVENAQYRVVYHQLMEENKELQKLKGVIDRNSDLKELVDEAMKGE